MCIDEDNFVWTVLESSKWSRPLCLLSMRFNIAFSDVACGDGGKQGERSVNADGRGDKMTLGL